MMTRGVDPVHGSNTWEWGIPTGITASRREAARDFPAQGNCGSAPEKPEHMETRSYAHVLCHRPR